MKYALTNVYKICSVFKPAGTLVVAASVADAVAQWCTATDSREQSINQIEYLGSAYTAAPAECCCCCRKCCPSPARCGYVSVKPESSEVAGNGGTDV